MYIRFLGVLFIISFATNSFADIIYSQPPTPIPVHIWQISTFRNADSFTLNDPARLDSIEFWVVGNPTFLSAFSGTLSWAIYDDSSGLPGTALFSGSTSSVTTVDTGVPNFFGNRYDVNFNLASPVLLAADTTYWLEIHEGPTLKTNDGTEILWVTGVSNTLPFDFAANYGGGWGLRGANEDLAFQLHGQAIPEPNTFSILGMGLIVILSRVWLVKKYNNPN